MARGPAQPRERNPVMQAPSMAALAGGIVVVVENDGEARQALCRLLSSWEAIPVGARNRGELRRVLRSTAVAPTIAILDYHLDHGECGLDSLDWLRARYGQDLPAIVATADHGEGVASRIRAAGAELIHKPIKPAHLRALISHLASTAHMV